MFFDLKDGVLCMRRPRLQVPVTLPQVASQAITPRLPGAVSGEDELITQPLLSCEWEAESSFAFLVACG